MNVTTTPKTTAPSRTAATTATTTTTAPAATTKQEAPVRDLLDSIGLRPALRSLAHLAAAALPESKGKAFDYDAVAAKDDGHDDNGSMAKIGSAVRDATGLKNVSLEKVGSTIREAVTPND